MALDPEEMALSIESSMTARGFKPVAEKGASHDWWLGLAEGIVNHIQSKAEVPVTGGSSAGKYKVT